ncbi:probable blue pigment (indigoidine) exporter [Actinacidiphila yanglinensis]|uniref:Probable blue pigment (Indigoidine) exporter n=1 Tax=Actinacidiphila yanglinensis TaxID=310779 RepID=A0A1H6DN56_9ACTN|nr:EamA family transporter [Actinacidiphila yanglinensis]SEG86601.1 probable blue pigment (indigoidine) exporter [Actinacidiphila yanglinensis]
MTRTAHFDHLGTTALTALAPISWGSTYLVTTQWLPPDRPLFAGLMRALPAGLLLVAAGRKLPHGAWWGKAFVLGALNIGAFFPLLFLAAYRLPGGVAAVVGAVGPLLVAGLSAGLLRERPGRRAVAAALLGAFGVSLVVLGPGAGLDATGVLAGLGGAAAMAAGTVLTKRWGRPDGVGPLVLTGWQLSAGGLLIAPVALLVEGPPPALDTPNVLGYGYLALVNTALAYALWFRGIARMPVTSVSVLAFLSTLSAAVIGWLALGQALGALQLAGMAVAVAGTLLGQRPATRTGRTAGQPSRPNPPEPRTRTAPAAPTARVAPHGRA